MKMRKYNTKSMKVDSVRVKEMYNRLKAGELSQGDAAREYGLGVIQVGRIARGESRAHETGALEDPVPNFNLQSHPDDIAAGQLRLKALLDKPAPKLYEDPPPEIPGEATGEGLNRLEAPG